MSVNVSRGMVVWSADGEKLGVVINRDDGYFTIEKGLIFKKDYIVRDQDVSGIAGDDIRLRLSREELQQRGSEGGDRFAETRRDTEPVQPVTGGTERAGAVAAPTAAGARVTEETRMPLAEEELVAEKTSRQVGEVRVRKEVHTEERQVTVPVTREEVVVERVPVAPGEARADEATFTEGEINVPVHEEEVELRKRPVVREEVRVSRTPVEEQRVASATVRREEAEVQSEGNLDRGSRDEDPDTRK
jgi:uncharacterized protein (TIGR02271 family)